MHQETITHTLTKLITILGLAVSMDFVQAAEPPKIGDPAPDFTLNTLTDAAVTLSHETAKQPVVLVVLRGWPGYQCPLCTRQVHEFVDQAGAFDNKARVLMVYPGPAEDLKNHARDFIEDKHWPERFLFVVDPDYAFTKSYGLRWDSAGETAYPSTFIIDTQGKIRFAKISKGHGGRSSVTEVVKALEELK